MKRRHLYLILACKLFHKEKKMIHSMSGGVIRDNYQYTFVKVIVDDMPYWYLSPVSDIAAGAKVSVPFGKGDLPREGVVLKVEKADGHCAPVPMNRIREIYGVVREEEN